MTSTGPTDPPEPTVDASAEPAAEPATEAAARPAAEPEAEPTAEELAHARPAVVRRAPRYRAFVLAGLVVAVVAATVLVLVRPASQGAALSTGGMWLLLVVSLGGILALLGALVAVVLDRRSRLRADRAAGRPTARRRRR